MVRAWVSNGGGSKWYSFDLVVSMGHHHKVIVCSAFSKGKQSDCMDFYGMNAQFVSIITLSSGYDVCRHTYLWNT